MFKTLLIVCLITLTQASDCVTKTIQQNITLASSNQYPFELFSPFPGKIVFKKHFDDNARNIMRITGQVSHQNGNDVSITASIVESVQAYTIQLNYEGDDFYSRSGASPKRSALTIGAVTTGLCVATNQYDTVSCAVLGGLVSLPFASAECQETVDMIIEVHESVNVRMRSSDQSAADIVRCGGVTCENDDDTDCADGDASECFSGEINFPYQVSSPGNRNTALPSSRSGRLLHLVKNAGTDVSSK